MSRETCLSLGLIVLKKHYDQGSSYKGQQVIGAFIQVQRSNIITFWQEALQGLSRHGATDGVESFAS